MNENVILRTKDLSIGYGKSVIAGEIDLSLREGEILCLLGPNGCGKSTLLRTLSGAQPALSGEVLYNEREINSIPVKDRARLCGIVTTGRDVRADLTVREVIMLGRYPYMNFLLSETEEDREMVEKAMQETGTLEMAHLPYHRLSDGQKQRVMLARALSQGTPLILLDEPASFLDLHFQIQLIDTLKKAAKEQKKALVIALHDTRQAAILADRILCFTGEKKTMTGTPEEILTDEKIREIYELTEAELKPEYFPLWKDSF